MTPAHTKRLASKVNQPGGLTQDEAVTAAIANLETMRDRTKHELDITVQQIRMLGLELEAATDPVAVRELYSLSNTVVGVAGIYGMSGMSIVAYSLCELIDRLRTSRTWNMRTVRIHIDSLLLMQGGGPGKEKQKEVQEALRRLLDRIPDPHR